jgi:N-methylhydantoinase A/oxoprolinase/acetone carboxylase beta subunit
VGGTNTDAVLLDQSHQVLGHAKALTTPDVLSGMQAAVTSLLASTQAGAALPWAISPLL